VAGYRRALAEAGIAPDPRLVVEGSFDAASGHLAMATLLERVVPSAVFVASDVVAFGVLRALRDAKLRVPEDVSVVGFDDSSAALACDPPLTTVHQPVEEMAAEMTTLVLRQIEQPGQAVASAIFHPTLVVRESS